MINLIFLGKRGGGTQLLVDTSLSLSSAGIPHNIFCSEVGTIFELLEKSTAVSIVEFTLPHRFHDLLSLPRIFLFLRNIGKLAYMSIIMKDSIVVQLLPSPFDWIIDVFAIHKTTQILRCIHDPKAHLGEKWPTVRALKSRIKRADKLIVFSFFSKNRINTLSSNISVLSLPRDFYFKGTPRDDFMFQARELRRTKSPIIAFLGRGKDYQGLNLLDSLPTNFPQAKFVLAGEGNLVYSANSNFLKLNYWLTDSEFHYLLNLADIIIFPYLEASQSGTIPICLKLNKCIVVSNVGGLVEQVAGYEKAFLFEPGNLTTLMIALQDGLDMIVSKNNFEKGSFVSDRPRPTLGEYLREKYSN